MQRSFAHIQFRANSSHILTSIHKEDTLTVKWLEIEIQLDYHQRQSKSHTASFALVQCIILVISTSCRIESLTVVVELQFCCIQKMM